MKLIKEEGSKESGECFQRTCEDFLADLQLDLEEITGTVGVMAHLGDSRDRGCAENVDIDDLCHFLSMLKRQMKELDERILSVLHSEHHDHPAEKAGD